MDPAVDTSGFPGPDAPSPEKIGACVHCGLCLPVCPTYRQTKNEASSPRGRLYLMRAISEERIPLSAAFGNEMYLCLGCRACETACPAGVEFGDLLERSRAQVEEALPRSLASRLSRRAVLQSLVPHRRRLEWVARGTRLFQRLGLGAWLLGSGLLEGRDGLRSAIALIPPAEEIVVGGPGPGVHARRADGDRRVGFFRGCVMDAMLGGTNRRTVGLLRDSGCEVNIPDSQTCCGALHLHTGLREEAKALARRNVKAFASGKDDAVICNSAGCGAALKGYGELLESDEESAGEAKEFAGRVRDISEYLSDLPTRRAPPALRGKAVYQDACHLVHGQRIRSAPRALLDEVPGLTLVPFPESDSCCGSAGIYNISRPSSALQILDRKMEFIAEVDPDFVIAGNPGCQLQLALGVRRRGLRARVLHTVDALSGGGEGAS